MNDVQDYKSRLSNKTSRKTGTFSYLPQMTGDEIRKQVEYIVSKGWAPAIEHTEPEHAHLSYWYMWKLPMFGETSVDQILAEVEACHLTNPHDHVRLIGYDHLAPTQGTSMVIYRGTQR
ncbi:Ribulose bisphosphate carboxylase small chain [invertebrate metagenome]|uniref:Ribulose bisphosphate carboxylase small chain n=1 Tax=invertebrate metagenome TaxID=1711999 RepID=A0A484H751_9ZZZZ